MLFEEEKGKRLSSTWSMCYAVHYDCVEVFYLEFMWKWEKIVAFKNSYKQSMNEEDSVFRNFFSRFEFKEKENREVEEKWL